MIVVSSGRHAQHDPATMALSPEGRPYFEVAARFEQLSKAVERLKLETVFPPDHGMAPIAAVHDAGYLHFLETCFARWQSTPRAGPAVRASFYAVRPLRV